MPIRKQRTFADKVAKQKTVVICPKCNGQVQTIFLVRSVKSDSGSWKFRQRHVNVCKCNQKEVYG